MVVGGGGALQGLPAWLTPPRLLALFCAVNLLVYLDRGIIACNGVNGQIGTPESPGTGIVGAFGLSLAEDGLLPAAFMAGLMVSSPIFAELGKHRSAMRLMGIGLGLWTLSVAATGGAVGFKTLLLARAVVGAGEASFVSLATPFIDDAAPPASKSRWLAAFYLCIPVGVALGYILGGFFASLLGWRAPFLLAAAIMAPLAALCLALPPAYLRGAHAAELGGRAPGRRPRGPAADGAEAGVLSARGEGAEADASGGLGDCAEEGTSVADESARADVALLAKHPVYVALVAAMTLWVGVLGTFAFYAPRAARDLFDQQPDVADATFGGATVLAGVLGTLAGGALLDARGARIPDALWICASGNLASFALLALAFGLARSFAPFMLLVTAGMTAMFVGQAPANAAMLWSVPPALRSLAVSVSIVLTHILGDVPGPPILGALQDHLGNWRLSMILWSLLLLLSALAYAVAARFSLSARDYRADIPPRAARPPRSVASEENDEFLPDEEALLSLEA